MGWKRFFKPGILKIIIFILLSFLLIYFFPFRYSPGVCGICPPGAFCGPCRYLYGVNVDNYPVFIYIFYLIKLALSYILSCIVVFLYDKIKLKK